MNPPRIGLAVALIYLAIALYIVIDDRRHPGFLVNMGTFLATAPISFPLSLVGLQPDYGNLFIVALLLLANAVLFYRVAKWLAGVFMKPTRG